MPVRAVVYTPRVLPHRPAPAAVICQPFNNPPEYSRRMALELAQDGFVVLTFDWRGRAREENRQLLRSDALSVLDLDASAAVAYLRSLPQVDPERITLGGHSVGGTLAIDTAMADPRIAGVASIGMEADVRPDSPKNLLWSMGLYDEFRVLNRMRGFFQASGGGAALESTTVGDFRRGNARRLDVSPTADHFSELQDGGVQRDVVRWFRQCVGLPAQERPFLMHRRGELLLVAWGASMAAAAELLRAARRPWLLRAFNGAALGVCVALPWLRGLGFLLLADLLLWLVFTSLIAGAVASREPGSLRTPLRSVGRFALVLWLSLVLTLVVNNVAYYFQHPAWFAQVPLFAVRHALDLGYAYLIVYTRPLLFSVHAPDALLPRPWVYLVLLAETVRPGYLVRLPLRLLKRRPQPASAAKPAPKKALAALAVLMVALVGVAMMRMQQGFLNWESALAAGRFMLRFAVLPILLFNVIWRLTRPRTLPPARRAAAA